MSKMTLGSYPHMLGFEQLERLLERTAKSAEGYPPFNIERLAEDRYRVTLAVAGFRPEEIDITAQQNLLQVIGRKDEIERVAKANIITCRIASAGRFLTEEVRAAGRAAGAPAHPAGCERPSVADLHRRSFPSFSLSFFFLFSNR